MADEADTTDKTEDPTQKKLDDALLRGDVAKSQEVNNWFIIAGGTLVLMTFAGNMSEGLTATLRGLIANSYKINVDGPALPGLFQKLGIEMLAAVAELRGTHDAASLARLEGLEGHARSAEKRRRR